MIEWCPSVVGRFGKALEVASLSRYLPRLVGNAGNEAVDQLEATGSALVHRTGNNNKSKRKKERSDRSPRGLPSRGNERKEPTEEASFASDVAHIASPVAT